MASGRQQQAKVGSRWLWQRIKQHPLIIAGIIVLFFTVLITLFVSLCGWEWTGFNGGYGKITVTSTAHGITTATEQPQTRTLWDWLQLLIIPIILTIGGFSLNQLQRSREERATEQRNKTEYDIALDNQRETVLQDYIDKISELLLEKHLRESEENDEVQKIARVRTLTVLPRLNPNRKNSVLQFIYEAGLIERNKHIIDLDEADLSGTDLSGINLDGTDLSGADLSRTDLRKVSLCGADLSGTDLREANLCGTNLCKASLCGADLRAANLREANLRGADLSQASLCGAKLGATWPKSHPRNVGDLGEADLSGANLRGTDLSRADLREVNLDGADLSDAYLYGADLSRANLSGANLSGAYLYGAKLSWANLDGANLSGAYLYGADQNCTDLNRAFGTPVQTLSLRPAPFKDSIVSRWAKHY